MVFEITNKQRRQDGQDEAGWTGCRSAITPALRLSLIFGFFSSFVWFSFLDVLSSQALVVVILSILSILPILSLQSLAAIPSTSTHQRLACMTSSSLPRSDSFDAIPSDARTAPTATSPPRQPANFS